MKTFHGHTDPHSFTNHPDSLRQMKAESSTGEGTIWPRGPGIFTTWPSTESICQLLIWEDRRWWPAGRQGRSGIQGAVRREVHLGRHPNSPALVLGNLGCRHGPDTGTDGGAGGHLAACEGPAVVMGNLRAGNGSNEAPEWGHRVATCPGQALGPGTAESSFPALTRPASRPQAPDGHHGSSLSMASRPGLSSALPARQRSPQSWGLSSAPTA